MEINKGEIPRTYLNRLIGVFILIGAMGALPGQAAERRTVAPNLPAVQGLL